MHTNKTEVLSVSYISHRCKAAILDFELVHCEACPKSNFRVPVLILCFTQPPNFSGSGLYVAAVVNGVIRFYIWVYLFECLLCSVWFFLLFVGDMLWHIMINMLTLTSNYWLVYPIGKKKNNGLYTIDPYSLLYEKRVKKDNHILPLSRLMLLLWSVLKVKQWRKKNMLL